MDMESATEDVTEFQLRRIGKPATVAGVNDVLKLKHDVTRFGRHSGNDFYLDSSLLIHFISRWHAEIHRVEQDTGIKYTIRDNSLNGTYVNEVRVLGNLQLQEGDHVVFGHINGKNIRAGEFAKQVESEFHFQFERVGSHPNASYGSTSQPESVVSPGSPVLPLMGGVEASDNVNAAAGSTGTWGASQESLAQHQQLGSPAQAGLVVSSGAQAASPSQAMLVSTTRANGSNPFVLKDISNTGCTGQGLVPLDQLIQAQTAAPEAGLQRHSSHSQDEEAEVFRQACRSADVFQADSDDDIFSLSQRDHETTNPAFQNASATTTPVLSMRVGTPNDASIGTLQVTSTTPHSELDQDTRSRSQDTNPNCARNRLVPNKNLSFSGNSNDDEVTSTHSDNDSISTFTHASLPPPPPSSRGRKNSRGRGRGGTNSNRGRGGGNGMKRKRGGKQTPTDRKKAKGNSVAEDSPDDSDEDNNWTWHKAGDMCASFECTRPKSSKVSWVQCDDCDQWFHTACVGCNYKAVKDDDTDFNCGCI